jgi:lipopolysaccharide biosynthesis protein
MPLGNRAARVVAFYLPQFHPIPENDKWWGKGFTEWANVAKAKPLFRGHYQPHIPGELGFYDLRLPEARQAQADIAKEYGIHGFCYYHYWFSGKRLLERPFNEVLISGQPDFPFCLCWANENWSRRWDGEDNEILSAQEYGEEDDKSHIRWLSEAFQDSRYIRVDGKPIFLVYRASKLPNPLRTASLWREEARQQGIGEIYLCKVENSLVDRCDPITIGFDAAVEFQPDWANLGTPLRRTRFWHWAGQLGLTGKAYQTNYVYDYAEFVERMLRKETPPYVRFPCVTPSWDNTARRKSGAMILKGSTPELYGYWLRKVMQRSAASDPERNLVFVNAWNEWGEGNHLEPDQTFGSAYLETTRRIISSGNS